MSLLAWAHPVASQTHAEALTWGPSGRYGHFTDLGGTWASLAAVDLALAAPADANTVFVSGGGDALRLAVLAAGSTGTLIEITDSATYNWVTFTNKSRVYVRARAGQTPKVISDLTPPGATSGGNSNAVVFQGDNADIGLQGITFLVGEHGNAESVRKPSKVGALRYSTLAGGSRLQGLLVQDCRFEPIDRALGAVVALQLANETGSTAFHRDIGIRRSVFDSTGTVAAAADDLAAVSVADFENVLVANVHFRRTSTQAAPSEMRGVRINARNGLVEYAYCEDIGSAGGANECVYVSGRTGDGLGVLDGHSVAVRNTAALSANRAFAVGKANSTLTVDHSVVVTGSADRILEIGHAGAALTVTNSIFLQLSGTAQLLTNPLAAPFTRHHNLYRWLGARPFTPDPTDKYPGGVTCDVNCDPQFLNPLGGDFRMATGSPALAAASDGTDMGLLLFSIDPAARSFGTSGGTGSVTVTASGTWSAAASAPWITPPSVAPTTGNGTVSYAVAANTSSQARTGTMTIAGIAHTVSQTGVACAPALGALTHNVPASGGTGSNVVTQGAADCAWTATSTVPWVTITSGASGSGTNAAFSYTVAVNAGSNPRGGTISVAGLTFTINQAGQPCGYALSPAAATVPAAAMTGLSVAVTASVGDCAWSATSSAGWLRVVSGAGGLGDGTVGYVVDANSNSVQRQATLTIAGQPFTVTQQGVACSQQLSSTAAFVGPASGPGTPVAVTSTAPDCGWTTTSNTAWITVTSSSAQTGSANVTWSVTANTSSQMRSGSFTIAGQTFTVNQSGVACAFTLSAPGTPAPLDSGGSTGSVGVTATAPDCAWTAISNAPAWLTVTSGASVTGSGATGFSVAPNPSSVARTATLTVAGLSYSVTQAGLSCAYFLTPTSTTLPASGGGGAVQLTAAVGDCTWTAVPNADWLSITSVNPTAGSAVVSYSAAPNPRHAARIGTITIAGQTFTVNQAGVDCEVVLGATGTTVGPAAVNGTVAVTSNASDCSWTIGAGASWVSASGPTTRSGSGSVSLSITANPLSVARSTTLTIAGSPYTVSQNGVTCGYSLSAASTNATAAGGALTVRVTTPATDCAWTTASNASWVRVDSGPSLTGTNDVRMTVLSNSTSSRARSGTVSIAGNTYTVNQAGVPCNYSVPKNTTPATIAAPGGAATLTVTTTPADCSWTAASDAAWLSLSPASAAGTGTTMLTATAAATTTSLTRSGNVTVTVGTSSTKVPVTQLGLTCVYTLSSSGATFTHFAANGQIQLTANASDCAWVTAKGSAAWLTLGTTQGKGSLLITYSVAANATTQPRQAVMQLAGLDFTVTQQAAPCSVTLGSTGGNAAATETAGTISVTAVSSECTWSVRSDAPWITFSSPAAGPYGTMGQGNGSIKFTAAANPSSRARTGTIVVNDKSYTLTQAGAACTYTLDPGSVTLSPIGGQATVRVTASVPDCAWTATPSANWIQLGASSGTGSSDVALSVASNAGTKSRTGNVSINGKNVAVTQTAQGSGGEAFTRYLAEGATSSFFSERLALLNPSTSPVNVALRFLKSTGQVVEYTTSVKASSRLTIDPRTIVGDAEFSVEMESPSPIVLDRTMTWDGTGYGSHAETAVRFPAQTWYLAEGSTNGGFDLFYLLQNPDVEPANVTVTFLRPGGEGPLTRTYTVGANSRFNIWVDMIPELARTDVSGVVTSDRPIIVERAMYLSRGGVFFLGGHESAGVTAPATEWFLAEGATGPYFDTYVLIANPGVAETQVMASYLLPGGGSVEKVYTVDPQSRFSIWIDQEDALLANTAVSTIVRSMNNVPIIVERAMWWPGNWTTWTEAHNSPGATETGTRWALAEGEVGGQQNAQTFVLIANTGAAAGQARVTLMFESSAPVARTVVLPANSRSNIDVRTLFPEAAGKRFGVLVESIGAAPAPIVVERAMYTDAGGVSWAAGTNALGTRLQ